ncbi:hypothetical protein BG003_005684 [Podila horticola]|nr:hypothetical protein BG003_005684 [Podila horticola]
MLADGPADLYVPFGQAADGSAIVVSRAQSFSFDLNSPDGWTVTGGLPNGIKAAMTRLTGAIDPTTNVFYLPGGFRVTGANDTMMQYSIAQKTATSLPMPSTLPSYAESTAVWSTYAKRLFLHGGRSPTNFTPLGDMYSFNPVDSSWSLPITRGRIPPKRYNHCMAADATGKRLVVFGGFDSVAPALSDIYILNVATMQWTRGPDAGNAVARAAPSCGIDHDLFIVWGGGSNSLAVSTNVTLVFDMQMMQWVNKFTPVASIGTQTSRAAPTPSSMDHTSAKSLSTGAIIGGIAGGLAIIAIAIGLVVYRRWKTQKPPVSLQKEEVLEVYYHPPGHAAPPSSPQLPFQQQQHHQHYHEQQSYQRQPASTPVHQAFEPPQYMGTQNYHISSEEDINSPSKYRSANPEFHPPSKGLESASAPTIEALFRLPQFQPDNPQVNGPHAIKIQHTLFGSSQENLILRGRVVGVESSCPRSELLGLYHEDEAKARGNPAELTILLSHSSPTIALRPRRIGCIDDPCNKTMANYFKSVNRLFVRGDASRGSVTQRQMQRSRSHKSKKEVETLDENQRLTPRSMRPWFKIKMRFVMEAFLELFFHYNAKDVTSLSLHDENAYKFSLKHAARLVQLSKVI